MNTAIASYAYASLTSETLTCPNGHTNKGKDELDRPCFFNHYGDIIWHMRDKRDIACDFDYQMVQEYGLRTKVVYVAFCRECGTNFAPEAFNAEHARMCNCWYCQNKNAKFNTQRNLIRIQGMQQLLSMQMEE